MHLSLMCPMHQHRVQYAIRFPVRKGVNMHKVLSIEIRRSFNNELYSTLYRTTRAKESGTNFGLITLMEMFFICCGHVSLDTSIAYFSSLLPLCPTSENAIWRPCCQKASSITLAADTARFNCSNGRRFYCCAVVLCCISTISYS